MSAVIGIDLGTTNSAMACWNGAEAEIIPNDRGSRITPSVVAVTEQGEILVGESAVNQAAVNVEGSVFAVKRHMGSEKTLALHGRHFLPEEICACIIRKMRHDAEEYIGEAIHDVVITVPAYFSEKQRRATVESARRAGVNILRIINEPTAAALAFASRDRLERTLLVYDLGGGTFDATCLKQTGSDFQVLATAGDSKLGGMDFTRLLQEYVHTAFHDTSGFMLNDPRIAHQLNEIVERGKIELSSRESTVIALPFISNDGKPMHLQCNVSRKTFNRMIADYVERSITITRDCLMQAGVSPCDIQALVLSGGSSRIPWIRSCLHDELQCKHVSQVNPDEIVALGAAIQASMLTEQRNMSLRDISAFDLGVEIDSGLFVPVLHRNSSIPATARRIFTTTSDYQSSAEIHVLQGNETHAVQNASLGRFMLSGIQHGSGGTPRIEVEFRLDADGLVSVKAVDQDTGATEAITLSSRTHGSGSRESLRARVQSLVIRLERSCRDLSDELDEGFIKEVKEVCGMARRAMLQQDTESIHRIQSALETLVIEIKSVGGITHESYT